MYWSPTREGRGKLVILGWLGTDLVMSSPDNFDMASSGSEEEAQPANLKNLKALFGESDSEDSSASEVVYKKPAQHQTKQSTELGFSFDDDTELPQTSLTFLLILFTHFPSRAFGFLQLYRTKSTDTARHSTRRFNHSRNNRTQFWPKNSAKRTPQGPSVMQNPFYSRQTNFLSFALFVYLLHFWYNPNHLTQPPTITKTLNPKLELMMYKKPFPSLFLNYLLDGQNHCKEGHRQCDPLALCETRRSSHRGSNGRWFTCQSRGSAFISKFEKATVGSSSGPMEVWH